jgi:hypothetical protein
MIPAVLVLAMRSMRKSINERLKKIEHRDIK